MTEDQWIAACVAHFKSGNATDAHWNQMAECLLQQEHIGGLDDGMGEAIEAALSIAACEHGIIEGDFCQTCNAAYKSAMADPDNRDT